MQPGAEWPACTVTPPTCLSNMKHRVKQQGANCSLAVLLPQRMKRGRDRSSAAIPVPAALRASMVLAQPRKPARTRHPQPR